jgi:ferric-dicitrate binding protein FerR (iron transport regulator)
MIPRSFRDATEPSPEAIERLVRSFSGRPTTSRLQRLPEPRGPVRTTPRRPRWPILVVVPLLAATVAFVLWPRSIEARLDAAATVTTDASPEVRLSYSGTGDVRGTRAAPVVHWEVGTLTAEVEPGTPFVVETDEGTATVLGTRFTVVRDALGTTISVERGRVRVSCGDIVLDPGQSRTCLPVRPSGWLARARALRRSDPKAAADAVLDGLAISVPGDPVRGELLALHIELLGDDPDAARSSARTYLREGYTARAEQIREFLGHLENP